MPKLKSKTKDSASLNYVAFSCFINALISFVAFFILSHILSCLMPESIFIKENIRLLLYTLLVICSVLNGLLSAYRLKIKAIIASSIAALFLAILIFILFAAVGNFNFTYYTLISILTVIMTTVISSIVFKNIRH